MEECIINGSSNISNNASVGGNFIIGDVNVKLFDNELIKILKIIAMNKEENEQALRNMTEAQNKLAKAIDTFAQAELIRSESNMIRAEAEKNNSLANLNYSKVMLEDREIIKQMMEKLK